MPNGFYSNDEWEFFDSELSQFDDMLESFSRQRRIRILRNTRDWPHRTLQWGTTIRKQIEIYLVNEKKKTYEFRITAWVDKPDGRYWKTEKQKGPVRANLLFENLSSLLGDGYTILESWDESDLRKTSS